MTEAALARPLPGMHREERPRMGTPIREVMERIERMRFTGEKSAGPCEETRRAVEAIIMADELQDIEEEISWD